MRKRKFGTRRVAARRRTKRAVVKPDYAPILKLHCEAFGLPEPTAEVRFHPKRLWRFDFCWAKPSPIIAKIALEVEGGAHVGGRHTTGAGFVKDIEKYSEAAILGWCVIRCTPQELNRGVAIDRVHRAFLARGWKPPKKGN